MRGFMIVAVACLGLVACIGEKSTLERVHGTWEFDYKKTWEFRNPGKVYTDPGSTRLLDGVFVALDSKEQTFTIVYEFGQKNDSITRYMVSKEEKDKVFLNIDNAVESFEVRNDDTLLSCPLLGGVQKCMVYIRKSGNTKSIEDVKKRREVAMAEKANAESGIEKPPAKNDIVPVGPFRSILKNSSRFVYLSLNAEMVDNQKAVKDFKDKDITMSFEIDKFLTQKRLDDINTAEGKVLLRAEIAALMNKIIGYAAVKRIYITEFRVE